MLRLSRLIEQWHSSVKRKRNSRKSWGSRREQEWRSERV